MEMKEVAQQLTKDLDLDVTPVQISFLDAPPAGLKEHPGGVPSWCSFWADARKEGFYAPIAQHESCEIGAFVLGIPPEGDVGKRLMDTLGWMQGQGYLAKGEEAGIPHRSKASKYVAYAPLGAISAAPSAVVLFAKPSSAMVAMEAASPGKAHPFGITMSGRPACAVIPSVLEGKVPVAVSLGCAGFRQFTEISGDKMLVAVRGDHVESFAKSVRELKKANVAVDGEMARRKQAAKEKKRAKA
jgi:uncharacterized protein (DUF169 family)